MTMDIQDGLTPYWKKQLPKVEETKPLMRRIGVHQVGSIMKNFRDGGRPYKWPGTHGASKTMRFTKKGKKVPGPVGRDTGKLMESTQIAHLTDNEVAVALGKLYGKFFHTGTKAHVIKQKRAPFLKFWMLGPGGKPLFVKALEVNHPGTKPRPVMVFQTSDEKWINDEVTKHIMDNLGG